MVCSSVTRPRERTSTTSCESSTSVRDRRRWRMRFSTDWCEPGPSIVNSAAARARLPWLARLLHDDDRGHAHHDVAHPGRLVGEVAADEVGPRREVHLKPGGLPDRHRLQTAGADEVLLAESIRRRL